MSFFRKLANWYFRKNALPYWSIFLLDGVILLLSGFISYWIFTSWIEATEDIVPLMCTLAVYVLLSIFGIRIFHTYASSDGDVCSGHVGDVGSAYPGEDHL